MGTCSAARPTARRCCAAVDRATGRRARTRPSARWRRCGAVHAVRRRRPGRRRRPRLADVQPAALPGDLVRDRRRAVPSGAVVAAAEPASDARRLGRAPDDDRSAMARLLHDDRSRRLVRRRAPRTRARTARCTGPRSKPVIDEWTSVRHHRRDRRAGDAAADPRGRGRQRRDAPTVRPPRRRRVVRREPGRVRATVGAVPPRWRARRRARSPPRRPSGATPTGIARARRRVELRHRAATVSRPATSHRCRSPGSASSTSPRSGPARSSGTRARCSAPK